MENFIFQNTTKIIFGKGTENEVGEYTAVQRGSKVLLHYGGGSIKKYGTYDKVVKSLKSAGIEIVELGGVEPNPKLSLVKEGIKTAKKEKVDFILAVGGGSVIDSAKAIAVGYYYDGDVWDFFTGEGEITAALPIGVVLTIPAAGSESSSGAVITKKEGMLKRDIGSELIRPQFAIMNPELSFTLPDYQTACGAADIMAHIMERYFTNTENVELTDRLSESTLKTIINNVPLVLENNEDYAARAEIMWAGSIAHNSLLGTGKEEDWASHQIEHELSGIYDVAHGAGLAVIFPAWMEYVYQHDLERFAQFAVRVWNIDPNFKNLKETAEKGIKKTKEFFKSIGMPVTLAGLDIPADRLEEMAAKAAADGPLGNFVELEEKDVLNIYKNALN